MVKSVACPLCGRNAGLPDQQLLDHHSGEAFVAVRCEGCHYRYLDPAPPAEGLERYYADNASGNTMRTAPGGLFLKMQRVAMGRETKLLRSRMSAGDGVVDLGAGDGALAAYFATAGFRAGAADFYPASEWPHAEIPYQSVDLHGGILTGEQIRGILGAAPRAATIRHVLEHLHRPRQVLEAVAASGAEWLYIVVPNCDSVFARRFGGNWYYWDPPRHLQFFNLETLGEMCRRAGFEVEAGGHYGIDELVTSAHRAVLLHAGLPARDALQNLTRPKGLLAGASSVVSAAFSAVDAPWARTVCWMLARRRG